MAFETEVMNKTVEQATAAGKQAFQQGVEKSISALNDLNANSKRNFEATVESATAATRGVEAIGAQAMAYGKKSWEDAVNAGQALSSARSVQELLELQTSFAKTSIEAYVAEMTRMTETVTASVKDTFKPINERVTATVETLQSAR
jgi:phasin family protein